MIGIKIVHEKSSKAFNLRPNRRTCVRGRQKTSGMKALQWWRLSVQRMAFFCRAGSPFAKHRSGLSSGRICFIVSWTECVTLVNPSDWQDTVFGVSWGTLRNEACMQARRTPIHWCVRDMGRQRELSTNLEMTKLRALSRVARNYSKWSKSARQRCESVMWCCVRKENIGHGSGNLMLPLLGRCSN